MLCCKVGEWPDLCHADAPESSDKRPLPPRPRRRLASALPSCDAACFVRLSCSTPTATALPPQRPMPQLSALSAPPAANLHGGKGLCESIAAKPGRVGPTSVCVSTAITGAVRLEHEVGHQNIILCGGEPSRNGRVRSHTQHSVKAATGQAQAVISAASDRRTAPEQSGVSASRRRDSSFRPASNRRTNFASRASIWPQSTRLSSCFRACRQPAQRSAGAATFVESAWVSAYAGAVMAI
jgi:hypothetical protein